MTHFIEAGKRFLGFGANGSELAAGPESLPDFSPYDFSQVPLHPLRRWLTYFQQRVVMAEGKRWPRDFKSIDPRAFQPLGISQSTVRSFLDVLPKSGFFQPVDQLDFDQHRMLAFAALVWMYVELAPQFSADLSKSPQDRAKKVVSVTKGLLVSYPQLVALIGDGVQQSLTPDDTIREDFLGGIRDTWLRAYLAEVQSVVGDGVSKRVSDIPRWSAFQAKIGLSTTIIRRLLSEILAPDLAVMNSQKIPALAFDEPRVLVFAALCRELKEKAQTGRYDALTWEGVARTLKGKFGSSALAGFVGGNVKTERQIWHAKQLQDILAAIAKASARNPRTHSSPAKRHLAHRSPSAATSGLVVARGVDGRFDEGREIVLPPVDRSATTVPGLDERRIKEILEKLSWSSQELVDLGGLELSEGDAKRVMSESAKRHGAGGFHDNPHAPLTHARLRNALELLQQGLEKKQGKFF